METIEKMLDELPIQVTREYEINCHCCGRPIKKRCPYDLQIAVYQIDGHKQFKIFYRLVDWIPRGDVPVRIEADSMYPLAEAIEEIKKVIKND